MDRFAQMVARGRAAGGGRLGARHRGRAPSGSARRSRPGSAAWSRFQDCYQTLIERGPDRVNPFSIPQIIPNMGAGWVSMELGTRGPLLLAVHRLRRVEHGDRRGLDAIRLGRADVMICGGTEAPVTRVGIAGFGAMRALSRRNDDPESAPRGRSTPGATAS